MIKYLFIFLLLSLHSFSASISFIGPCDSSPIFKTTFKPNNNNNLGSETIQILEKHDIPHIGSEAGLVSAFNTPTGDGSIEVISDVEMNAYGWCYSINGDQAKVYPNEVILDDNDKIVWWWGFAKYYSGEWVSQCEPSHKRRPAIFCN